LRLPANERFVQHAVNDAGGDRFALGDHAGSIRHVQTLHRHGNDDGHEGQRRQHSRGVNAARARLADWGAWLVESHSSADWRSAQDYRVFIIRANDHCPDWSADEPVGRVTMAGRLPATETVSFRCIAVCLTDGVVTLNSAFRQRELDRLVVLVDPVWAHWAVSALLGVDPQHHGHAAETPALA
jgi:hypothetical protein